MSEKKEETNCCEISFSTFILSLASSAYCFLGHAPNPITQKIEVNLLTAKQQIDLLMMLKEKTEGNLDEQEEQLVSKLVYELQNEYVKASSKRDGDTNLN